MPKKNKIDPAISATPEEAAPVTSAVASTLRAPARKRAVSAPKAAAAKKKPKAGAAKKSTPKQSPKASEEPSDTEIQLRAYFLAERRLQLGLPGDSAHDWLEARKQLTEEAAHK